MITTIIPTTTGGLSYLTALMPALAQEPDMEIIIVDNFSRDGTCNYLQNYDCTIKVNKTNLGFSKANNQGARIARGEYLLFLNNDMVITPGFAGKMLKTLEGDPKIGIVGCLICLQDEKKRVQHAGVCFTSDYIPYELGLDQSGITPVIPYNDPRVHAVRPVPSVTAACMLVGRSLFESVNGFDEGYLSGWEDTDLVLRIRELGHSIFYNGEAVVYHKHFGSRNAGRFRFETQNRQRYDSIWVTTGRARKVLGDFRNG